jgi:hypothetical protein
VLGGVSFPGCLHESRTTDGDPRVELGSFLPGGIYRGLKLTVDLTVYP